MQPVLAVIERGNGGVDRKSGEIAVFSKKI
jgi:hypothetical protein